MDSPPTDFGTRRHRHRLKPLEWLTVAHLSLYLVATTWAFGGQSDWVRTPLTAWGSLGLLITLAALLQGDPEERRSPRLWWWAAPVLAFNLLVGIAAFNPSFREIKDGADTLLVPWGTRLHLPSSARPKLAWEALLQFDVIWAACFNIVLLLRRRRAVRMILLVAVGNAAVLAVFGTVQRLLGAPGLFMGAVATPQNYFFASFVYHNHWGAFMVLMIAACLGLTVHYRRRRAERDFFHSPAFFGLVVALLLAATVPLSASRSCTILVAVLLAGSFVHGMARLVRARRQFNESIAPPIALAAAAVTLSGAAIWHLAGGVISQRVTLTEQQISHARTATAPDARLQLYRDTWRMAQARPWTGWGMASYPHVFTLYNTRESVDRLPVFYHDAHSDWLQALAEHGFVGTFLLGLCGVIPLTLQRRALGSSPLSSYLLAGCGLVLAYAWVEFPFGNYAVVLTWWTCFLAALQYARLTAAKAAQGTRRPFAPSP